MDANPYLAIAASLAAGFLGLIEQERPDAQYRGEAYEGEEAIPRDLAAALDLFDAATGMHDILGPEFARVYSIVKRAEYNEFLAVISPWEREHLPSARSTVWLSATETLPGVMVPQIEQKWLNRNQNSLPPGQPLPPVQQHADFKRKF